MNTLTLAVPRFAGSPIGQLRRALQLVAHFVVLHRKEWWHSSTAKTLVQMAEMSQLGAVIFVQGIIRWTSGSDVVATVGRDSVEILAKLQGDSGSRATLQVTLPYGAILESCYPTDMEAVLTCDEAYLRWAAPRMTEAGLVHAFKRVEGGVMVGEAKYLEGFVNG